MLSDFDPGALLKASFVAVRRWPRRLRWIDINIYQAPSRGQVLLFPPQKLIKSSVVAHRGPDKVVEAVVKTAFFPH